MLTKIFLCTLVAVAGMQLGADSVHAGGYSHRGTGVYVNGLELGAGDVATLCEIIPGLSPGHYWLDNQGYFGRVGEPAAVNVFVLTFAREAEEYVRKARQAYWQAQAEAALRAGQTQADQYYGNQYWPGNGPTDNWFNGDQWSGRTGMTHGTRGTNPYNSIYSVDRDVLTLPY